MPDSFHTSADAVNIDDYNYDLSQEKIAKFPLDNRDDSKLLLYDGQNISETVFNRLHEVVPDNSLLVFNNTKVIRARLRFFKPTGAQIEIFCLEPFLPATVEEAFKQKDSVEWICMAGNLKKWKEGEISAKVYVNDTETIVSAVIIQRLHENIIIRFSWNNSDLTFAEILDAAGQTPIPPYLNREAVEMDNERYQTVYSKHKGSVAAPTAGLHFTDTILNNLVKKGVKKIELTLHVGAGTFKPVKNSLVTDHKMHTEHFSVSFETIKQICEHQGPVIAVGTTSTRTLESLYIVGLKIKSNGNFRDIEQWDGFEYESDKHFGEVFGYILQYMEQHNLETFEAATSIMIIPGFNLKVIDGLITNFHQPRSTLLLLIAALAGDDWKRIYRYALNNDFRFLSYGDSSFLCKTSMF